MKNKCIYSTRAKKKYLGFRFPDPTWFFATDPNFFIEFCKEPGPKLHIGITSMSANPGSVLKISIKNCDYSAEKYLFVSVANRLSMLNIFDNYHGHINYSVYDVSNATEAKFFSLICFFVHRIWIYVCKLTFGFGKYISNRDFLLIKLFNQTMILHWTNLWL